MSLKNLKTLCFDGGVCFYSTLPQIKAEEGRTKKRPKDLPRCLLGSEEEEEEEGATLG
jgi:hypothetical protein